MISFANKRPGRFRRPGSMTLGPTAVPSAHQHRAEPAPCRGHTYGLRHNIVLALEGEQVLLGELVPHCTNFLEDNLAGLGGGRG